MDLVQDFFSFRKKKSGPRIRVVVFCNAFHFSYNRAGNYQLMQFRNRALAPMLLFQAVLQIFQECEPSRFFRGTQLHESKVDSHRDRQIHNIGLKRANQAFGRASHLLSDKKRLSF